MTFLSHTKETPDACYSHQHDQILHFRYKKCVSRTWYIIHHRLRGLVCFLFLFPSSTKGSNIQMFQTFQVPTVSLAKNKDKEFGNRWYGVHRALILSSRRLFWDLRRQKQDSPSLKMNCVQFLSNALTDLLTNDTTGQCTDKN